MIDWDVWTVDDVGVDSSGNRIECRKVIDIDAGKTIAFVIRGARGPDFEPAFDGFTMDGREPTEAEHDEYSSDLRAIVWDSFTDN
jgi:hypothetical protein